MRIRRRHVIDIAVLGLMGGVLIWTCSPPYWTVWAMAALVSNTVCFLGWCQLIREGAPTNEPYWLRQHPLLCEYYRTGGYRYFMRFYFRRKKKEHPAARAYFDRAARILVAADAMPIEDLPFHLDPECEENKHSEGTYTDFIKWRLEEGR